MIRSWADRETEAIWSEEGSRRLPGTIQQRALNKLALLNRAKRLDDLRVPPGNRQRQHSIRINEQWRVCFRWETGDAYESKSAIIIEV